MFQFQFLVSAAVLNVGVKSNIKFVYRNTISRSTSIALSL